MNKTDPTSLILTILVDHDIQKKQAYLYQQLFNESILLTNYFQKQQELDFQQRKLAETISWEDLRNISSETYTHEMSHHKVFQKYGIQSGLFHIPDTKTYFVMDMNFEQVATKRQYNLEKVTQILKEMLQASFLGKNEIRKVYILDLFFYEILAGNINNIKKDDIYKSFTKYNWDKQDFINV